MPVDTSEAYREPHAEHQLRGLSDHVVRQPASRDTGIALYVALAMIKRWAPDAIELTGVEWSDWGRPERIETVLALRRTRLLSSLRVKETR